MSTVKQINATSVKLGQATKKLQSDIHNHAVLIAEHIAEHGDVTIADVLVEALGKSIRANALRQWFLDLGGCSWNEDKKRFGKKKDFEFEKDVAEANPFYDYVPEAAFKPVNGEDLLKSVVAKMRKAIEDTDNQGKHNVDKNMLRALERILEGDYAIGAETEEAPVAEAA